MIVNLPCWIANASEHVNAPVKTVQQRDLNLEVFFRLIPSKRPKVQVESVAESFACEVVKLQRAIGIRGPTKRSSKREILFNKNEKESE